jgi:hypothetical protein
MYTTTFSAPTATYCHDADHGFCTVCGAVWPCSRARRSAALRPAVALATSR